MDIRLRRQISEKEETEEEEKRFASIYGRIILSLSVKMFLRLNITRAIP